MNRNPQINLTEENVKRVKDLILSNKNLKDHEIEKILGIPKSTVQKILCENHHFWEELARWVNKNFTDINLIKLFPIIQ